MRAVARPDESLIADDMVPPVEADSGESQGYELFQPVRPAGSQNKGEPAPES